MYFFRKCLGAAENVVGEGGGWRADEQVRARERNRDRDRDRDRETERETNSIRNQAREQQS